jgi:hypothetical protein
MATFGQDKYRYTLTAGQLTLPKATFISALHKTDRRDLGSVRAFLVIAFFRAVAREATIPSTLMGGITNEINRFAIAVFEEGSFLQSPSSNQSVCNRRLRRGMIRSEITVFNTFKHTCNNTRRQRCRRSC